MNIFYSALLAALCLLTSLPAYSQKIAFVNTFDNTRHPQILYWFWDDGTITGKQYLKDIDRMAEKSPFDMVILTSRFKDNMGFWRTNDLKPYLADAVRYAHEKGIKIAIQLWPMNRTVELQIPDYPIETKDAESFINEGELTLNASGRGRITNMPKTARWNRVIRSELVKVWLFKKTSDGFYDPVTLKEAEKDWIITGLNNDFSMTVNIHAPKEYAGYTAYVLTEHYYHFFDVLSTEHFNVLKKMLDDYSDIPFDGAALDENGNLDVLGGNILESRNLYMDDRTWSDAFENHLRETGISDPVQLLFDMRYVPENRPEVRIRAINTYFDERLKGPVAVEKLFYDYVKKLYGKDAFIGCHSTFHNSLNGTDIWTTGVDWWDLPREYGQTDETQPMPDRMGIGISGTEPIVYNMYYSKSKDAMLNEALSTAAYGVREHYHAWNDVQGWGKDVGEDDFLEDLKPVEERIRLLNHFDPAAPKLSVLAIYNFPYMLNWFPDADRKNRMGTRNVNWTSQANSIWKAGYPCAAIPSTWLERGMLTVRKDGKVQVKDRIFDAVVFFEPQYGKPSTLAFLKELADRKVPLMTLGEASLDFDGRDCSEMYRQIARHAIPFDVENIGKLGIAKNPVMNGIFLQDGSLVMSDYPSVKNKTNTEFKVKVGKDEFSGSYQGVFALKTDKKGNIEKLAGGNFRSLQKNGKTILELKNPADILIKTVNGKTNVTIKGKDNEIVINRILK
ncbi:MAG: hypothetical protein LBK96_01555 [Prevotellaceae bacterium]|jgi:hypothetical protein|nr:hypothetical protein [Prevotellaceae bacterium]